jgi:hypothetical protein
MLYLRFSSGLETAQVSASVSSLLGVCWREMYERTANRDRISLRDQPRRCYVNACKRRTRNRVKTARFLFWESDLSDGLAQAPLSSSNLQSRATGSRKTLPSSSVATTPSGSAPRLYSAMRFFHFRKSVMLCGSIRTSTRRRLASSKFISF